MFCDQGRQLCRVLERLSVMSPLPPDHFISLSLGRGAFVFDAGQSGLYLKAGRFSTHMAFTRRLDGEGWFRSYVEGACREGRIGPLAYTLNTMARG